MQLRWEGNLEGVKTRTRKGQKETFGDDGWVRFLDCDSFKVVYMSKCFTVYILNMYSLFHFDYILILFLRAINTFHLYRMAGLNSHRCLIILIIIIINISISENDCGNHHCFSFYLL